MKEVKMKRKTILIIIGVIIIVILVLSVFWILYKTSKNNQQDKALIEKKNRVLDKASKMLPEDVFFIFKKKLEEKNLTMEYLDKLEKSMDDVSSAFDAAINESN
jgi:FtsZ-interacting cell division protein ZipA